MTKPTKHADSVVADARALHPGSNAQPVPTAPARFSPAKRDLLIRHAGELRAMELDQYNDRLALVERQAKETAALDATEAKK